MREIESNGFVEIITERGLRTGYGTDVRIGGKAVPELQSVNYGVDYNAEGVVRTTITLVIAGDEVVKTTFVENDGYRYRQLDQDHLGWRREVGFGSRESI